VDLASSSSPQIAIRWENNKRPLGRLLLMGDFLATEDHQVRSESIAIKGECAQATYQELDSSPVPPISE